MTIRRFKKTPAEIMRVLHLFHQNNLSYNLFKCEHIFDGANKNLDILFEVDADYTKAARILEQEGYALYLPERIEKYKQMHTLFRDGVVTRIHLHREIAWHGLCIFDKNSLFSRAQKKSPLIFVPSPEDQLLIHVAHVVFENLTVSNHSSQLISTLVCQQLDWPYIQHILKKRGWEHAFNHVLSAVKNGQQPNKNKLIISFIKLALKQPSSWLPLARKSISLSLRPFQLRRRGCLIACIGVNGAGKTTLTKKLLEAYFPLSRTVQGQSYHYFGWVPFSSLSKLISRRFQKKGRSMFQEMNINRGKQPNPLFREAFFLFNFFEYLLRYFFFIRPQLVRNKLVITDRYFYDLYGQYSSAESSSILLSLLRFYPEPDFLFVLDAPADVLKKRGKFGEFRMVKGDLAAQRRRYFILSQKFGGVVVDTTHSINENISTIIYRSWKKLVLNPN